MQPGEHSAHDLLVFWGLLEMVSMNIYRSNRKKSKCLLGVLEAHAHGASRPRSQPNDVPMIMAAAIRSHAPRTVLNPLRCFSSCVRIFLRPLARRQTEDVHGALPVGRFYGFPVRALSRDPPTNRNAVAASGSAR